MGRVVECMAAMHGVVEPSRREVTRGERDGMILRCPLCTCTNDVLQALVSAPRDGLTRVCEFRAGGEDGRTESGRVSCGTDARDDPGTAAGAGGVFGRKNGASFAGTAGAGALGVQSRGKQYVSQKSDLYIVQTHRSVRPVRQVGTLDIETRRT